MPAVIVTPSGSMRNLMPMNGKKFSLFELQQYVGGYIEIVYLKKDKILVVDEEGKLKGKPINRIATGWLNADGIIDYVAGTAILMDSNQMQ